MKCKCGQGMVYIPCDEIDYCGILVTIPGTDGWYCPSCSVKNTQKKEEEKEAGTNELPF